MKDVIADLERVRRRSRGMLIAQRLAVIVAAVLGAAVLLIGVDYLLRLPSAARLVLLLGGLSGLAVVVWTYIGAAVFFRPSLTQVALRVEHILPSVSGRLASSVEFASAGVDQSNDMASRSVSETQRRLTGESITKVLTSRRTWLHLGLGFGAIAIAIVLVSADPASASTGLKRMLMPYSATKWPARTGVQSLMHTVISEKAVFPRGQALPLRARVTRGPLDQRLDASYRLRRDDKFGPWQPIVLTHQGSGVHERLVDTSADEIEFYFSSDDDQTSTERIALAPPPEVVRATLYVMPPDYAALQLPVLEAELGQGTDDRAVTETPSLIGSDVLLRLELNKPLPTPAAGEDMGAWLVTTLGWEPANELPEFSVDPVSPAIWILRWQLAGTRALDMHLVDEHGLTNSESIAYRIEAVEDRAPAVTVTDPPSDEAVLPTAAVNLRVEAQDDVALTRLGIESHVVSSGEEMAQAFEFPPRWNRDLFWNAQTPRETGETAPPGATGSAELLEELDLATLQVKEGDIVLITGVANDVYELGGQTHDTVRSPARRLRVISELELATQLRQQLAVIRQNAIRIEAMQAELQDDVREFGVEPGADRAQAQLGERLAGQAQDATEIAKQLRRNRLDDPQLARLLAQTTELLDFAGRASNQAVEEIQKSTPSPGQPPQANDDDPEKDEPVVQAQQEVRDELSDLIKLLDRDEDTWIVRQRLERLLNEQGQLQERTQKLGEQTLGQTPEELSDQQQSELERIVQRQRDIRDEAQQLTDEMRDRAEALDEVDPQAADTMRSAADTAEQQQLDQDMEQAAQRAEQNQMTASTAAQQRAENTMERMLDEIEQTPRTHLRQLIRHLASLIESIDRLITMQENELTNLALAMDANDYRDLDRTMIRLNQNTQSVASEARTAGQEARRVARTLDRAADAQGAAVVAFRADPIAPQDALLSEEHALKLLNEARALAEALQEQAAEQELQQQREALVDSYKKFAEQQVAVRAQTLKLAGVVADDDNAHADWPSPELDRRQLVEARRLGTDQDEIRTALNTLRDTTSAIIDSLVFSHVHRSIDIWSAQVTESLTAGTVAPDVTDRQQLIADSIGRLIEALEEKPPVPEDFARGESGAGGQGGAGQESMLIPDAAQLRLLHGIQELVLQQTQTLDRRPGIDAANRRTRLREVGQQQRELVQIGQTMIESLQPPGRPAPDADSPDEGEPQDSPSPEPPTDLPPNNQEP